MDPTLHVGMLNRMSNLEEAAFTNVGIDVGFIYNSSFHKWPYLHVAWVFVWVIAQHTWRRGLLTPTHIK